MSIGDINSSAKGSGARFNDGKPPMELIPAWVLGEFLKVTEVPEGDPVAAALIELGLWQNGGSGEHLLRAMRALDPRGVEGWKECALVFQYGISKYAAWNWAKGMAWSVPLACAVRHLLFGIAVGDMDDPESKYPHRGHVYCNLVMLLTYERNFPEGDDRPKGMLLPAPARTATPLTHQEIQRFAGEFFVPQGDAKRRHEEAVNRQMRKRVDELGAMPPLEPVAGKVKTLADYICELEGREVDRFLWGGVVIDKTNQAAAWPFPPPGASDSEGGER